jgi:hypothetical protein
MDGGDRPAVEFLDDDPVPGTDEPLPPAGGRLRWLVLGGAAVLVLAGVVVAREAGSGRSPAAAGTATATPPAVVRAPIEPAGGPSHLQPNRSLLRPVPELLLLPTPRCGGAGCSVLSWVADATLNAITTAFPGEVVERQMSAFAPSASDVGAGHPLLAREVRARHGRESVVVDVIQALWSPTGSTVRRARAQVIGIAVLPGYVIEVRVLHGRPGSAARVHRLLAEPGLLAVR